ncbi:MAG: LysR substrate-binding domain-containing protein, partial [Myxococcota bacterium]
IARSPLGRFGWATFARKGHPIRRRPTIAEWTAWPHVQVDTGHVGPGPVSRAATAAGVERRIHVRIPNFLAALPVVAGSDMLFTTLHKPFRDVARGMNLRVIECPLDLPAVDVAALIRQDSDAAVTWLRDRTLATCSHQNRQATRQSRPRPE